MSAAPPGAATVATAGSIIVVLTDVCDWQEPLRDAARLAATTGRRLRVVLADSDELLAAASLDCVKLLASGGLLSAFDPRDARRLLRAELARLRKGLRDLAARFGIEVELIEAAAASQTGFWTGGTALTVFGRRRRGVIMVVHAGTTATLEVAARLAAERHQAVHLLSAAAGDQATLRRLFGPWLAEAPEPLLDMAALPRPAGRLTVAALVIDPAWLEHSRLTLAALREQWLELRRHAPEAPARSAAGGAARGA